MGTESGANIVIAASKGRSAMSIVRLIFTSVPPGKIGEAVRNWKHECAPIMIRQKGCTSEQLLHSTSDANEFISYSEWETQSDIDAYLQSADHQEIKRYNEKLGDTAVVVKTYERV
jgi:heme-degrading monooxygenase HmoA